MEGPIQDLPPKSSTGVWIQLQNVKVVGTRLPGMGVG